MDASYNNIQQWKYKDLVNVFGADPKKSKTFQVKTKQEAEDLFKDKDFCSAPYLQVYLLDDARHSKLTIPVCRAVYAQRRRTKSAEIDSSSFSEG